MFSIRVLNIILAGSVSIGLLAPLTAAASETVQHAFQGAPNDGAYPKAGLIDVHGTLYGTTDYGGANSRGTVFKITTAGVARVLHSFGSGSDGAYPVAGLINVADTLYGTTSNGGTGSCTGGCGTVFKITTSGIETVLYSFKGGRDGAYPVAGLINVAGTLYGTTSNGGIGSCTGGCGTVFKITTAGIETVLYSFGGGSDGAYPEAGLINVAGTLYGTTSSGGGTVSCTGGCGTVFKITTAGIETVLHSFGHDSDGVFPYAGLINVKGSLYGTTAIGGASGPGTVFKITTAGVETVLYSFKVGSDGANPYAGLIDVAGTLYGTTVHGGTGSCTAGCGTVFKITTKGMETVLHSFKDGRDGANPYAGLIDVAGTLYGNTSVGGASGNGTVFKVAP